MSDRDDDHVETIAERAAERAAEKALENVMLRMGIDTDDKEGLQRWRDDLAFLARMKRGTNQISNIIIKTCVGAAVAAFLWMLVQGFRDWLILPRV